MTSSTPTSTIFLVLRRLRTPLIVLILIFALSVLGLTAVGVGGALGGHIVFKLMDDPAVEAAATPVLDPILDVVN